MSCDTNHRRQGWRGWRMQQRLLQTPAKYLEAIYEGNVLALPHVLLSGIEDGAITQAVSLSNANCIFIFGNCPFQTGRLARSSPLFTTL